MLLHFREHKLSHRELLESFDLKKCPESSIKQNEVFNLLKELTNSAIYFKILNESGIDTENFNFSYLNKDLILKARSILGEINILLEETNKVKSARDANGQFIEGAVDKILEFKNKIYDLSSRYYELIPKLEFRNSVR